MLTFSGIGLIVVLVCLGMVYTSASNQEDERMIRRMIDQSISRLNKGDITAIEDFWDEDADYVGVDGRIITGRTHIQAFFGELVMASAGRLNQSSSIDRIRFLTPEIAIVDGSWTITGARDNAGKEIPPIKGRGVEIVQKKEGQWRFVATRQMVVFKGN
ncbi:MAG: SgcJ/EcaC family oxidoreductase [Acidobacteria bacterium]|nr:SgcJ/EcaC family oxidoreductase [Acidobacteriota bacterium]